ncbi:hypothetical protein [Rhodoferax fermentans]|uniref:Uncharacterized protein n=1 Tax=Rhodoferax fermentans TaxID=28066 RepID=A0A1T1ANE2_RHOFE|nr:hypothetical protein [Rhodoferax fermentans]MBK1685518.1 hypothetical protein [Rhodoferax fermentans]OOV05642.1 hypothetical protein RF819_01990 [Rhodoferax fermentans]
MGSLATRLQALEARPPKADPVREANLHAALSAMRESVNWRNEWAPAKVAPFYWVEQPSDLELLASRIEGNTATEVDWTLMQSWPKCHIPPEQLVQEMASLKNQI